MLALSIHLLTGRYVATAYNDRRRAEWPPHPARVFSALVATHFETESQDPAERDALLWLEQLGPPAIHASEADRREVVDVFVPVNDAAVLDDLSPRMAAVDEAETALAALAADDKKHKPATSALAKARTRLSAAIARAVEPFADKIPAERARLAMSLLPDRRVKQARTFPSVTPRESRVTLTWREASPDPRLRQTLDGLAARVVRIGHSSSLVSVQVLPAGHSPGEPAWVPDEDGAETVRVADPGQFERLCADHARHLGVAPRIMPAATQTYARPRPAPSPYPSSSWSDEWIVLGQVNDGADGESNPRLPSTSTVALARAVRHALMRYADPQPPPEIISGHGPDGAPSGSSHLAVVPLPNVGGPYPSGLILGVALVVPRGSLRDDLRAVRRAVGRWEVAAGRGDAPPGEARAVPVLLGPAGKLWLRRAAESDLAGLDARRWTRPARRWASVTPVALDRHPGDLWHADPERQRASIERAIASVADGCERLGLPRPAVEIMPYAPIAGAEKVRHFPPYPPIQGRTRRMLVHATLRFDEPVIGPLLLGAGRYLGLGLMLPLGGGAS